MNGINWREKNKTFPVIIYHSMNSNIGSEPRNCDKRDLKYHVAKFDLFPKVLKL